MLITRKQKKIIRFGAIALIILILILLAIGKKKGWIGKSNILKISTEMAEKRTLVETVAANGRIQPEVEVIVTPDVSGEIVDIYVKEGDQVKKGDLLAKINPDIYLSNYDRLVATLNTQRANLSNARARLAQARAQFTNTKLSYERNKGLYEQKVISTADFDAANASYKTSRAELEAAKQTVIASKYTVRSAEAAVKEARDNLSKTSIFAPMNGTVSTISKEKGERVAGASQFGAGTEIMRVANLNEMEVNVSVNENDIVRVSLNDTSLIEVDAYLNRKFKGIVTQIANSANLAAGAGVTNLDQVTNFDVKIRILRDSYLDLITEDNTHISPFRPGMSATVDIQTETASDILTVPIQAVTTRSDTTKDEENRRFDRGRSGDDDDMNNTTDENRPDKEIEEIVFVYDNGTARLQKVKTGIQDNTYIQILEGLDAGQEVITAPYSTVTKKLKDGDQVKKVERGSLFSDEKK